MAEVGDALMPGIFFLAMRPILSRIQNAFFAGAFVFAYLDDIHIICHRDDTISVFQPAKHYLKTICHIGVRHGDVAA